MMSQTNIGHDNRKMEILSIGGRTHRIVAILLILVILFETVFTRIHRSHAASEYNMTRQEVLEILITNSSYNSRISPDYELDHATTVHVQIYVLSIDTVNEQSMFIPRIVLSWTHITWESWEDMEYLNDRTRTLWHQRWSQCNFEDEENDYSMNIYLRQRWVDPRLSFSNYSKAKMMELDAKIMTQVWVPDTFFRNEKKGEFHMVTVPNRLMHLYRDGTIYYSMRLSVLLSCHMRLQKYPLDIQSCPIKLASYGYTTENIIYGWLERKPVDFVENLQLSQYTLVSHTLSSCTKTYKETGSFSCVQADLILKRDVGYYIIQVYVPSVLIVILSWVSFWLDVEAIPARISLGVLTVLTMTTQSSGARASLPRVSYVKAIDVWMAACLIFVFASLLEFAYVNVLARRRVPYQCFSSPDSFDRSATVAATTAATNGVDSEKGVKSALTRDTSKKIRFYGKQGARYMDKISRFLFPFAFIIFNAGYWLIYCFVDM